MGYPMASYLSTSTIGLYDDAPLRAGPTAVGRSGQPLKFYDFIGSALTATATKTQQQHQRRTPGRDHQVHGRHDRRAVPVRLARRRRGPRAQRRHLRARGPDQVALRQRQHRHRHARARDRAPVVRRQRRPGDVARDLVQRGLGHVVGDVLVEQAERQLDHERLVLQSAVRPHHRVGPRARQPGDRRGAVRPRSRSTTGPRRCSRATTRSSATRPSSPSRRRS